MRAPGGLTGVCFLLATAWLLTAASALRGQYMLQDEADPHRYDGNHILLPFAFYSPTYRFGGGVVFYAGGLLQPQTGTFAYALGSTHGTYGFAFGMDDLQLNPVDRLFVDSKFGYLVDHDYDAFIDGSRRFAGRPAGVNDSSADNFITDRASDAYGSLTFKYLLPIGSGRDTLINWYVLRDGLLVSGATGGRGWNPLESGRTYLTLSPFFDSFSLETPAPRDFRGNESGLRVGLAYDNTDFPLNPASGNVTRVTLARDFGLFGKSQTWTNVSAEFSQFLDLGRTGWFRQQVLAMNVWTSYSPTWDDAANRAARQPPGAPPFYDGATLGGSERLRGFAEHRFWDRAALYGAIELRLIPDWNPFRKFKLLAPADLAWMQWVVFAEAGRTADAYTPELFSHLKADAGFGLRLLANDTLVRFDIAVSIEGVAVVAQLSQPF